MHQNIETYGGGSWSGMADPTIPGIDTEGDFIAAATIAQGGSK